MNENQFQVNIKKLNDEQKVHKKEESESWWNRSTPNIIVWNLKWIQHSDIGEKNQYSSWFKKFIDKQFRKRKFE
jgi:hypothetical protein